MNICAGCEARCNARAPFEVCAWLQFHLPIIIVRRSLNGIIQAIRIGEIMKKLGIGCAVLAVLGIIVLVLVAMGAGGYNRLVKN